MVDFALLIQVWFRQNKRDLPWRTTGNPYNIWLSEIILQQTRVDQGLNYYLKFTEKFPSVVDLANASEDEVLNLWQGLGYYSRARNMHASAKYIKNELNGIFPKDYKTILSLKGVGEYTAAAIASIAYNLPHAVVDGNVYRVLSRYFEIDTPIDSTAGKKEFSALANELLDQKNPGDHNQALMEIGALVCKPKNPQCETCPLENSCLAHAHGTMLDYPVKSKKTKVVNRNIHYLIITDGEKLVLNKRTGKGIWQGLYDFPMIEKKGKLLEEDVQHFLPKSWEHDGVFKHILSHQKITANFWVIKAKLPKLKENQQYVALNEVEDHPLPQLLIRYLDASTFFRAD